MITAFASICFALIIAKWIVQFWLEKINQRHVEAHAGEVPAPFREIVNSETYSTSVRYTLAKSRFHAFELGWDTLLLLIVLFSGVLPWFYGVFQRVFGDSIWAGAGFLLAVAVLLAVPDLPLQWYEQFQLEERFGFNTTTPRLWWIDRLKGFLLSVALGFPLLVMILKLVRGLGAWWWLWAWACVAAFQLVMMVVGPILILPLFNKFSPLPAGPLRDRLLALAERTGFHAKDIQVMDGSKRSRHSNAFFTGLGRFRKIVLFDTLVEQLDGPQLEAVLAHEIGHYKKRHIPKMIVWSMASLLLAFYAIAVLAQQKWFYESFGFSGGDIVPAFLLFGLLSGLVTFWFSPLAHRWSRKYEYQADAYAAKAMRESQPLIGALRKLNEKNLSNLTPHPYYSTFYYSHPTLLEREEALVKAA